VLREGRGDLAAARSSSGCPAAGPSVLAPVSANVRAHVWAHVSRPSIAAALCARTPQVCSTMELSPAPLAPPSNTTTHNNARTQRSDVGCRPLQPPQWWLRISRVLLMQPVPIKRPPSTRPNLPQGLFCKLYARTLTQHTNTHNTDALMYVVRTSMHVYGTRTCACLYTHTQ
jgi:hypothetical protein